MNNLKMPKKDSWLTRRLKYLSRLQFSNVDKKIEEGEESVKLCNYVDVYYHDFITSVIDFMIASASPAEIEKFKLSKGDVLLTKDSETADDIGIPAFVAEDFDCLVCGYHLAIAHPNKTIDGKYLFRFLSSRIAASYFETRANGITRFAIGLDAVGSVPVSFPPLSLQKTIASYLDKETARIDALIFKKERQIDLLQEKRQAIITHAVTNGLDPKAKMKYSGVEWIGEIPEGWEVQRLKYLLTKPLEYGANESAEEDDPSQPRYIRITDFDDSGKLRDETFKSLSFSIAKDYLLQAGDILFARSGATVGKTFQYKEKTGQACFAGYLIRATPNERRVKSDFIYYFTKSYSYENWKDSIFIQATIQNIGAEKYANLFIPVPTLEEQTRLIKCLDAELEALHVLQEKVTESVSLLKEYRSSLINTAVSGQIDVTKEDEQ